MPQQDQSKPAITKSCFHHLIALIRSGCIDLFKPSILTKQRNQPFYFLHMQVVKTWNSKKDKNKSSIVDSITSRFRSTFTTKMIIIWAIYLALLFYVKAASAPMDRFDPFEILQIPESASEGEIKKAYRKLSLQYHPDKNPDPASADYFANYIAKAYRALTDEASRENYKKYGHPDGQQAVSISVALPEWFFNKDKEAAPAILLSLLLGGIVLPLGLAACYLGRNNKYTGANEVMMETVQGYMLAPYGIKQYQGVGKMLDTLVCAMEFMPPHFTLTADQGPGLQKLIRDLSSDYPELRDRKSPFLSKRRMEIVKAHLLMLAHMSRVEVDPTLKKDLSYVLEKTPRLIQELFSVSVFPRIKPNYGWLAPSVATVELLQCFVKAVSVEEKKKQAASNPTKSADGTAALLQLPHVDEDVVRQLFKRKIKNLAELQGVEKNDRRAALQIAGLSVAEVEDLETALSALPCAFVSAKIYMEGSDGAPTTADPAAFEHIVTCDVHVMLLRKAHQEAGFDPDTIKGTAARAYAPNFPYPRDEHWFFLLGDLSTGALLAANRVSLLEAEAVGARYAVNWMNRSTAGAMLAPGGGGGGAADGSGNPLLSSRGGALLQLAVDEDEGVDSEEALVEKLGQRVEFKFVAPASGKHDLTLFVMPDSWIGCDRVVQLKLKTVEMTRAEREGRAGGKEVASAVSGGKKKKKAPVVLDRSEESELMLGGDEEGVVESDDDEVDQMKGSEDDDDEDGEEREDGDEDYGNDEYGTEESGSEDEEESEEED